MIDFEIFYIAVNNIMHQKLRSYLTLLGIVIGIAAIVALISIGSGLQSAVTGQLEMIGLDAIFVEPGAGDFMTTAFGRTLKDSDVGLIEAIPGVEEVLAFYETSEVAEHGGESAGVMVVGFDPSKSKMIEEIGMMTIAEGRGLAANDKYSVVVGEVFAEDAFSKPLALREKIKIGGRNFRIVGLLDAASSSFAGISVGNIAYMHKETVRDLFGEKDPVEIGVRASSADAVPAVVERIKYRLEKAHGEEDFSIITTEQILTGANSILGLISLVLVGIAAIALIVGGIGIMNTMLMAVIERTREIGVMKAIGATNSQVLGLFLVESGLVGAVGGAIGIAAGLGISAVVAIGAGSAGIPIDISLNPILVAGFLVFSLLLGMLFGALPAIRASGLDPVEALRYE